MKILAHAHLKSASALSRFLTVYTWSVRQVIRQMRQAIRQELKRYRPRGRRPHLQVILDMTTLEKRGKFTAFSDLINVFHGKRGVHLVGRKRSFASLGPSKHSGLHLPGARQIPSAPRIVALSTTVDAKATAIAVNLGV